MRLEDLGWDAAWSRQFESFLETGLAAARVAREDRERYRLLCEHGELSGEVTGKFRGVAGPREDFPAVGDWVAAEVITGEAKALIHAVLPRRTVFRRTAAGGTSGTQIVAANVDTVFLVSGLDNDFNPRRIERYLTLAYDSGAQPVVVLNKADLSPDIESQIAETEGIALGAPVCAVSALDGEGVEALRPYIRGCNTVAFLGSSGVGKSTLINALAGVEHMATGVVREDDSRGRHTTTHRQLIVLREGGILIDTPGMRELQLTGNAESLGQSFSDVETLTKVCRFSDCTHRSEPGCAITEAIKKGELDPKRLDAYRKLKREIAYIERRQSGTVPYEERQRAKALNRMYRRFTKEKQNRG